METVRKTRKLPEQVADKLREMIIQESLKTGAKLPAEAELMERFGVSRSTVREAVKILQTEHYVKVMTVEEAILQMNLLGHSFFVFRNTDDDNAICVVYTRNSGGYGIIETGEAD